MPDADSGGEDYCSALGLRVEDVPIAQGPLSAEEWLVLITYFGVIGLILKGAFVCGRGLGRLTMMAAWMTQISPFESQQET